MTSRTTLDLHQLNRTEPTSYDFDLSGCDATVSYIRDHLPNAKTTAQRDKEILDNEHAIRRWMDGL